MATKNLTEKSRATAVEAIAKSGEFEYGVNYSISAGKLLRLQCTVNRVKKVDDRDDRTYSGVMTLENTGNQSMSFPADVEPAPHVAYLQTIIAEVKAEIQA